MKFAAQYALPVNSANKTCFRLLEGQQSKNNGEKSVECGRCTLRFWDS